MKKSFLRITAFLLILCLVLGYTNKVFKMKSGDGTYSMTNFYDQEDNSIDVLILGSSRAYQNINTGTLWDNYGIASYILGGSNQEIWSSYYYLKEALKTQTPELIILEGYFTISNDDYSADVSTIMNTFGLHWSKDKIEALKVSAGEERLSEFILEYGQYHARYTKLSDADFLPNQNKRLYDDWKGFACNINTRSFTATDVSGVTETSPLYEKEETYYRKIIELAQENDIPIMVAIAPYAGIQGDHQAMFNSAAAIAGEYGVPFVNFNLFLDEIGLDYSTDAADSGHLNYNGSAKFADYLGSYIKENFVVSDRHGDEAYDSWERHARYIARLIQNQKLKEVTDLSEIIPLLQDPDYWLILSIDGECNSSDPVLYAYLNELGITEEDTFGIWLITGNSVSWSSGEEDAVKYLRQATHNFSLKRTSDDSESYSNVVNIDNEVYQSVKNGLNVIVYDTKTEKIADSFGINVNEDYEFVR